MSQRPASKKQIANLTRNLDKCMQALENLPPEVQEMLAEGLERNGITEEKINKSLYILRMLENMPVPPLASVSYNRNIPTYV